MVYQHNLNQVGVSMTFFIVDLQSDPMFCLHFTTSPKLKGHSHNFWKQRFYLKEQGLACVTPYPLSVDGQLSSMAFSIHGKDNRGKIEKPQLKKTYQTPRTPYSCCCSCSCSSVTKSALCTLHFALCAKRGTIDPLVSKRQENNSE